MKRTACSLLVLSAIIGVFLAGAWYGGGGEGRAAAPGARKILYYVDPMHPSYRSDTPGIAPDCGMALVPVYEDGSMGGAGRDPSALSPGAVQIRLEQQALVGMRLWRAEQAVHRHTLRALGRVVPDETRVYRVNAGIGGYIREVSPVTTGSQVQKEQLLASFSSPDSIAMIQAYLVALNAMDRLRHDGQERAAQTATASSNFQQRLEQLQNLGMSALQMEEIKRTREVPDRIRVLAPAGGFVLARTLSVGQKFDRGAEWYRIADLDRIWILADVFLQEARHLGPGVRAKVILPELGQTLEARVAEVLPQFDESTRTLKVRLEADNPGYVLRPGMFVDVELPVALSSAIAIPADAVSDGGKIKTVFVERGEGRYEPRTVETGWRFGGEVEIVAGLQPGERVVVEGAFLLDSESRMRRGAGAGDAHSGHAGHGPAHTSSPPPEGAVSRAFADAVDPTCGMTVDTAQAKSLGRVSEYRGVTYHFCSDDCKQRFDAGPKRTAKAPTLVPPGGSATPAGVLPGRSVSY
jgi:RND family efflux transporter MFP subunit